MASQFFGSGAFPVFMNFSALVFFFDLILISHLGGVGDLPFLGWMGGGIWAILEGVGGVDFGIAGGYRADSGLI